MILLFLGYQSSFADSILEPLLICTLHSIYMSVITLRQVFWQWVGKFLLKSLIAFFHWNHKVLNLLSLTRNIFGTLQQKLTFLLLPCMILLIFMLGNHKCLYCWKQSIELWNYSYFTCQNGIVNLIKERNLDTFGQSLSVSALTLYN